MQQSTVNRHTWAVWINLSTDKNYPCPEIIYPKADHYIILEVEEPDEDGYWFGCVYCSDACDSEDLAWMDYEPITSHIARELPKGAFIVASYEPVYGYDYCDNTLEFAAEVKIVIIVYPDGQVENVFIE